MTNLQPHTPFNLKDWMVPPVLIPIALAVLLAIWAAIRSHVG
jgi:hypothetical protein